MRIDFELVRELLQRVEQEAPFKVELLLTLIKGLDPDEGEDEITILVPDSEGTEFLHWRWMAQERLISVTHDARPGFGKSDATVKCMLSKGHKLFELSRHEDSWQRAKRRCEAGAAITLCHLMNELRREASMRVKLVTEKEHT